MCEKWFTYTGNSRSWLHLKRRGCTRSSHFDVIPCLVNFTNKTNISLTIATFSSLKSRSFVFEFNQVSTYRWWWWRKIYVFFFSKISPETYRNDSRSSWTFHLASLLSSDWSDHRPAYFSKFHCLAYHLRIATWWCSGGGVVWKIFFWYKKRYSEESRREKLHLPHHYHRMRMGVIIPLWCHSENSSFSRYFTLKLTLLIILLSN